MTRSFLLTKLDIQDDIVWVTINRPGDRNAINSKLMEEVESILSLVENTPARAIVFHGAGDAFFIGGADAVEMIGCSPDDAFAFSDRIQKLFNRMETSPLLLVAAIDGLCYGGGFEFSLACDFRLAVESARIGLPEVRVGIIPGGGGTQRLPKIVGKAKALEIILKGTLYSAEEALSLGLINDIYPQHEMIPAIKKYLKPFLRNPQHALSNAKRAVQACQNFDFADGLYVERERFKECFRTDFFVTEIKKQLKSGQMKTTESLDSILKEEKTDHKNE
ncbi:enoyl-CoA hydratase/isomerase family protein [bacterium]|nr:enoyl-CoA hydratase/isomerase family protein [bacterium]